VPPSHATNDENCNDQGENDDRDRGKHDGDHDRGGRKP
jgi:hypothetical protein